MQKREAVVHVPFCCDLELRDREKFQAEGHYSISTIRGPVVYILTHLLPQMGGGGGGDRLQICRTQGGTEAEATRAMQEGLATTLWGLAKQDAIQGDIQKQFRLLNAERNRLAGFLMEEYRPDELMFQEPAIDAAIRLLRKERRRWWGRLVRWARGKANPPAHPPAARGPHAPHADE